MTPKNFHQTIIKNRGSQAKQWLEKIPALLEQLTTKWQLEQIEPYPNLTYNFVAKTIASNKPAVLKVGFTSDREFQSEIAALQQAGGKGLVKLLQSDPSTPAMLLEQINPGTTLDSSDLNQEEQIQITSDLLKNIHLRNKPDRLITTKDWGRELWTIDEFFKKHGNPYDQKLLDKARKLYLELEDSAPQPVLLHGDLHHQNILASDQHGWLAIDPKGIYGDPHYDIPTFLRNPIGIHTKPDLEEITRQRVNQFAQTLNLNQDRIWGWAFATTMLSSIWDLNPNSDSWKTSYELAIVFSKFL